jgi:hypothetical protein
VAPPAKRGTCGEKAIALALALLEQLVPGGAFMAGDLIEE